MNLYLINYKRPLAIPIIANVVARSEEECLYTLSCHLSNLSESAFCDDSILLDSQEGGLIKAIKFAEVFVLEDKEELTRVVYYQGP